MHRETGRRGDDAFPSLYDESSAGETPAKCPTSLVDELVVEILPGRCLAGRPPANNGERGRVG
jgi:hypothetical protein